MWNGIPRGIWAASWENGFLYIRKQVAEKLQSNLAADQRLCSRYIDSTVPLIPKSEIACLFPLWLYSPVSVAPRRKRQRQVSSQRGSHWTWLIHLTQLWKSFWLLLHFYDGVVTICSPTTDKYSLVLRPRAIITDLGWAKLYDTLTQGQNLYIIIKPCLKTWLNTKQMFTVGHLRDSSEQTCLMTPAARFAHASG